MSITIAEIIQTACTTTHCAEDATVEIMSNGAAYVYDAAATEYDPSECDGVVVNPDVIAFLCPHQSHSCGGVSEVVR